MLIKRLAAAFSGLCLGLLTCSVQASTLLDKAIEAHEATPPKTVSVDIIANRTAGTLRSDYAVAIRLRHEPGWHTYWRYAGDTGYADSPYNGRFPKLASHKSRLAAPPTLENYRQPDELYVYGRDTAAF